MSTTVGPDREWLINGGRAADELHNDIGEFLESVEAGDADTDEFRDLERSAIEALIEIRDAAHAWGAIDDEQPAVKASEDLLRAAHSVDGDRLRLAGDRIDDARQALDAADE